MSTTPKKYVNSVTLRKPSASAVNVEPEAVTAVHVIEIMEAYHSIIAETLQAPIEEVPLEYDLAEAIEFFKLMFSSITFSRLFTAPEGKGYLAGFYHTMSCLQDGTIDRPEEPDYVDS